MWEIDWPWVKLSVLETFQRDYELRRARRHTSYGTLRHIDIRVARFLDEPSGVQRAALLLLMHDGITHEAGNRGVAATVLVTGLTNLVTVITAVVAVILAAFLGLADQFTPENVTPNQEFLTASLLWVGGGLAVVLFAVIVVWSGGGQRDRRRATSTLWRQIFIEARSNAATAPISREDEAVRAWLRGPGPN